jgi:hypothetical protein
VSSVSLGLSDLTRTENSEEDPTPGMHSSATVSTTQDPYVLASHSCTEQQGHCRVCMVTPHHLPLQLCSCLLVFACQILCADGCAHTWTSNHRQICLGLHYAYCVLMAVW